MIAEAAAGQGPTLLVDAAPNPLPLAISYDATANMSFTAPSAHRGLAWSLSGSTGRAKAAIGNSKIATRLGGKTMWTLETVVDVANCTSTDCRVLTIATDVAGYGSAALIVNDSTHVSVYLDGAPTTFAVLAGVGRIVLHAVIDTTAAGAGERIQLFINGVAATETGGGQPAQNAVLTLGAGDSLVVGNVDTSNRSFAGTEFYAALYDVALTPLEITAQAAALAADDDTP
jgi:hypothetical protein